MSEDRVDHTWVVLHDQSATNRNSSVNVKGSTKCGLTGTAACCAACRHISIIDTVASGFVVCNAVMLSFDKVLLCCLPPFLPIGYCCATVFGDLMVNFISTTAHSCVCATHQKTMTGCIRHQEKYKRLSKHSWQHGETVLLSTLQQSQSVPSGLLKHDSVFLMHTLIHLCPKTKQQRVRQIGDCTCQKPCGRI